MQLTLDEVIRTIQAVKLSLQSDPGIQSAAEEQMILGADAVLQEFVRLKKADDTTTSPDQLPLPIG